MPLFEIQASLVRAGLWQIFSIPVAATRHVVVSTQMEASAPADQLFRFPLSAFGPRPSSVL
jgi:hypothetical protein